MELTGKIIHIGEAEKFEAKNGSICTSREIVLETEAQYPRRACITLRNDLAQNFDRRIGDTLTAHFDIDAFANKEGTRYSNKLTAWRIS